MLEWPLRAPAGRCHERLGHGLAVRSGRDRTSVCVAERLAGSALTYDHYQRRSQHGPGRVTLGRWQVLRASARVWAAPPGAATASGGCAASRRQWLTDETDSPLEQAGFELPVPPRLPLPRARRNPDGSTSRGTRASVHRGMLREQRPNSFGVAGGDPHTKTCRVQMADNAPPKKPRPAKYCHCLHGHDANPYRGRALLGTRLPDSRGWRHAAPKGLLRGGRNRIEFAAALLDPPRADVALHCHADMVRAIARTCRV